MTPQQQHLIIQIRLFAAINNEKRPEIAKLLNSSENELKTQLNTLKNNNKNK